MNAKNTIETNLPIRGISDIDFGGCLFINGSNNDRVISDTVLKLESSIVDFAKREVLTLVDFPSFFSEAEVNNILTSLSVISPLTLMLFFNDEVRRGEVNKMSLADKEGYLLEHIPGKIRARFKANLTNRNARDIVDEVEDTNPPNEEKLEEYEDSIRVFGTVVDELFYDEKPKYILDYLSRSA